jgi:hypothetical protein
MAQARAIEHIKKAETAAPKAQPKTPTQHPMTIRIDSAETNTSTRTIANGGTSHRTYRYELIRGPKYGTQTQENPEPPNEM